MALSQIPQLTDFEEAVRFQDAGSTASCVLMIPRYCGKEQFSLMRKLICENDAESTEITENFDENVKK